MNLELLESFGQNYPEEFDGSLDCTSLAVTSCFNRRGTLLAVGCNDGRIVIWDFLTRGIAKIITAHLHPVCSISWSRSGYKLLSAGTDNNVCVWDVMSGECEQRYRFPTAILKVQFHPRKENLFLVCLLKHASVLIDSEGGHHVIQKDEESDSMIVASFDKKGEHIYAGNGKGKVLVISCPDLKLVTSFKVISTSTVAVRSIEFSRRGDFVLLNCSDRIIRVYDVTAILRGSKDNEIDPLQKLQDLVNRTMWKKCCFSGDGEYVCAGSARQHALYIWERSVGNLQKILHGTKGELLLDVVWHPVRPIIASISNGVVSIWAQNQVENWSAFAPDFKELDENVEYDERESEFDVSDEDKSLKEGSEDKNDDVEIDVTSEVKIPAYYSSDDEDEPTDVLQFLPVAPEVEDPEDHSPNVSSSGGGRAGGDSPPAKRPKYKSFDIELEGIDDDEPHPLVNSRKEKSSSSKKTSHKRVR